MRSWSSFEQVLNIRSIVYPDARTQLCVASAGLSTFMTSTVSISFGWLVLQNVLYNIDKDYCVGHSPCSEEGSRDCARGRRFAQALHRVCTSIQGQRRRLYTHSTDPASAQWLCSDGIHRVRPVVQDFNRPTFRSLKIDRVLEFLIFIVVRYIDREGELRTPRPPRQGQSMLPAAAKVTTER